MVPEEKMIERATLKMMVAYKALRREHPNKPSPDIGWMEVMLQEALKIIHSVPADRILKEGEVAVPVVMPECGYRFNTHCLCAIPSSRVLKDGEVAVGAATMTAYRSALSLAEFASEHEIDATWRVSFQSVREHFGALRAQGKEGAT